MQLLVWVWLAVATIAFRLADAAPILEGRAISRTVTTPALRKSYTTDFTLSITGGSSDQSYLVDIANNVGFVTVVGRRTSVVITKTFEVNGETLYTVFGVDHLGPVIHVCYCSKAGQLVQMWAESTTSPPGFAKQQVSGTCSRVDGEITGTTDISASTFTIAKPAKSPKITGGKVKVDSDGLGILQLPGESAPRNLLAYGYLDCISCERAKKASEYKELHVVLSTANDACTAVLYLWPEKTQKPQVAWIHCLQMSMAKGAIPLDAIWTPPS